MSDMDQMLNANEEFPDRIRRAQAGASEAGVDALLLSPGSDLRYLTGYQALPLERVLGRTGRR